jgi:hypothetical protein
MRSGRGGRRGVCKPMRVWREKIYARLDVDDPFLAASPRPYMGGEVSGSGLSRLQINVNPN